MKKSILFLVLAACGSSNTPVETGKENPKENTSAEFKCITSTPVSNADFLNACTLDAVVKIEKTSAVPRKEEQALPSVQ